jgi:hypothetical protein
MNKDMFSEGIYQQIRLNQKNNYLMDEELPSVVFDQHLLVGALIMQ